jgi:hypothetical protein
LLIPLALACGQRTPPEDEKRTPPEVVNLRTPRKGENRQSAWARVAELPDTPHDTERRIAATALKTKEIFVEVTEIPRATGIYQVQERRNFNTHQRSGRLETVGYVQEGAFTGGHDAMVHAVLQAWNYGPERTMPPLAVASVLIGKDGGRLMAAGGRHLGPSVRDKAAAPLEIERPDGAIGVRYWVVVNAYRGSTAYEIESWIRPDRTVTHTFLQRCGSSLRQCQKIVPDVPISP